MARLSVFLFFLTYFTPGSNGIKRREVSFSLLYSCFLPLHCCINKLYDEENRGEVE